MHIVLTAGLFHHFCIIVFSVQSHIKDQEVIEMLKQKGIAISLLAKGKLRIVTHLDYRQVMHEYVLEALEKLSFKLS
jgi:threonine aldolase